MTRAVHFSPLRSDSDFTLLCKKNPTEELYYLPVFGKDPSLPERVYRAEKWEQENEVAFPTIIGECLYTYVPHLTTCEDCLRRLHP
jgi:hypothetical protein